MFASRTATGLAVALLALPATAAAKPAQQPDQSGGGDSGSPSYSDYHGLGQVRPNPDQRSSAPTSSRAGTTSRDLRSPDAADAARAGELAKAMEHYERSQPAPAAARPASPPEGDHRPAAPSDDTPAWPEIAFAGAVLLATAGGVVRVRLRRARPAGAAPFAHER
jgi:hypothetical protein